MLYLTRVFESSLVSITGAIELVMLGITSLETLFSVLIATFFMMAGIYSWNDALDIEEDQINHPERPIPSGAITSAEAKIIGSISLMISAIFFFLVHVGLVLLFIIGSLVGIVYSFTTKHMTYGKILTILVTSIFGALLVPIVLDLKLTTTLLAFVISITALLFGYEILKDMRDVAGDRIVGISTLAFKMGHKKATMISATSFIGSCLFIAAFFFHIGLFFESVVSFGTGVAIVPFFWILTKKETDAAIDMVRLAVILMIGISLNAVAISIYLRNIGFI